MGWRGAMYAWESADTGAETTPEQVVGPDGQIVPVLCGKLEQHVTADVAYAVWQYWQATGDEGFLLDAGAEIMLETGRFWSSRAQPETDGHCHIRGVIGPDEYHENIDDNAFTNVMARWNIRRALDVVALLRERWPERWAIAVIPPQLDDAELKQWQTVAETITTGFDPKTGLFEQFAGSFAFNNWIWRITPAVRSRWTSSWAGADAALAGHQTGRCRGAFGSADRRIPGETAALNFGYYEPRCGHGSSLSAGIHGLVAARLGHSEMALRFFRQAAAVDLSDTHVAIAGGLHVAALGGIWHDGRFGLRRAIVAKRCAVHGPKNASHLAQLSLSVQWRGRRLRIRVDQAEQCLEATLETGEPMPLVVSGERRELRENEAIRFCQHSR